MTKKDHVAVANGGSAGKSYKLYARDTHPRRTESRWMLVVGTDVDAGAGFFFRFFLTG